MTFKTFPMPRIDLRQLIMLLSLFFIILSLSNGLYSSYQVQQDLLLRNTLDANRVYSQKLASSVDYFLETVQQNLRYSAGQIVKGQPGQRIWDDPRRLLEETQRLKHQSNSFNSVLIIAAGGEVLATTPETLKLVGTILKTDGARQAMEARAPLVSGMFTSATGRLVVFISHPLFAADGTYLGYVGGSIYLYEDNVLHNLLGKHYYEDGSYLYVVDERSRLVYHHDGKRVGQTVHGNPAIEAVLRGETGSQRLINSLGQDMLAGYAPLDAVRWGIIAQRPVKATLAGLNSLMLQTLLYSLPLLLASLIGVWWLSLLISRPLWQLARRARRMDEIEHTRERVVAVRSWYYEVAQLKRSLLISLSLLDSKLKKLNHESLTDQLTGLSNRRGLEAHLKAWEAMHTPFSLIVLDIDHFKRVNDQFGHDVGDQVLQSLAASMQQNSRPSDLLCRTGGEEFAILLPNTPLEVAAQVAERLREYIATEQLPTVGHVTISLGIASYPETADSHRAVFKQADVALYEAKKSGRNRSLCFQSP